MGGAGAGETAGGHQSILVGWKQTENKGGACKLPSCPLAGGMALAPSCPVAGFCLAGNRMVALAEGGGVGGGFASGMDSPSSVGRPLPFR